MREAELPRLPWSRRHQGRTVGFDESPRAVVEALDHDAALVHLAMMEAAQRDEVRELRFATVGPVTDVMAVDITCVRAAREQAATVARIHCPAQRGRNRSRATTHIERFPALVLVDRDDARVAGQSSRRFDGNRRALVEIATARRAPLQRVLIDMNDDLVPFAAIQRRAVAREITFGEEPECISTAGAVRGRVASKR